MNMMEKAKLKNKNKLMSNNSKKSEEKEEEYLKDIIKTPNINMNNFKFKTKNLFRYEPGIYLCKIIDRDNSELTRIASHLETLNQILGNYLFKPKINIKLVELKIKNEALKKEKEILEMKKNLEEKIELVLEKANSCLDNIKQLSKNKSQSLSKSKNSKPDHKIEEKSKIPQKSEINENTQNLKSIVKNLSDKYNDELIVNQENLNFYFTLIANNRKNLKELKEKNKNLKIKIKNSKNIFGEIYSNRNVKNELVMGKKITSNSEEEKNLEAISNSDFHSNFYKQINSDFWSFSVVDSILFEKLYINVLFRKDQSENENFIFDVFSMWFLLKKLKNFKIVEGKSSSSFIPLIETNFDFNKIKKESNEIEIFVDEFCIDKLIRYLDIMFKLSKNKNNLQLNFCLNEEEIFGKEFFQIFDYFIKIVKLKYMKIGTNHLKNLKEKMQSQILPKHSKIPLNELQKEELIYLKSIYSILVNNCGYSYEICKKQ